MLLALRKICHRYCNGGSVGGIRTILWFALAWPKLLFGSDDSRFGAMTHFAQGWETTLVSRLVDAHVGTVRDELYWQEIENRRGHYVFPARYERYMDALRHQQIDPLIVLSFANRNYDKGETPFTDKAIGGYARYATEVLRHYGRQIREVEVWNEYNGSFCSGPAAQDRPASYARLLRATSRAVKQVRPDVIVAGASTVGVPLPYFERLFSAGALEDMDVVAIHPYCYDVPPEGLEHQVEQLQALIKRYNHGLEKPIWVTEIGWYTKNSQAPGDLEINEYTQAKFLVRAYALLLSAGVERIYWYLFRDYEPFGTMGLVHNDRIYSLKPAGRAMVTLAHELSGAVFVRRETSLPTLYSLVFRRSTGEEVRVLWSLESVSVHLGGPVRALDLNAQMVRLDGKVVLNDAPLFVEGKLEGLPAPLPIGTAPIANSYEDFSDHQGGRGWFYGYRIGDSEKFDSLESYRVTDWNAEWSQEAFPNLSITAQNQHPSALGRVPIAVVRRWCSDRDCLVRLHVDFRCGVSEGDGVRVSVWIDGKKEYHFDGLGGRRPVAVSVGYDHSVKLSRGSFVDVVVDPGPDGDFNFDAVAATVHINPERVDPSKGKQDGTLP